MHLFLSSPLNDMQYPVYQNGSAQPKDASRCSTWLVRASKVFILLLFVALQARGQAIKGKVYLESDSTPAQFASVGLLGLPDSAILGGVITLSDGGYSFEKAKPGRYYIKVSFMGYAAAGKEVLVSDPDADTWADTIFLAETATNLEEVTIVGERLKGRELVDRTIYAIPSQVAKVSNNGYDLLKRIPQVNVDFQNNVTLNGSANFIIQVDGRQRDKEFLAKLLPSDIESIEIVSNPSGKYEGNIDGVINIVLKKEARYGVNGNVGIYLKPFNRMTAVGSGSLDYAMGKITFYITGYTFTQKLDIMSSTFSRFSHNDSTSNASGNGNLSVTSTSVNSGFDYYVNEKNSISLNINFKPINQQIDVTSESVLGKYGIPENNLISLAENGLNSIEGNVSVFYKRTFSKAVQELVTEVTYYRFGSTSENNFINNRYGYFDGNLINTQPRYEDDFNERDYLSAKVDYTHPIGLSAKVEAGYQGYYQDLAYDFKVNKIETDNLFDYAELRNSAYAGFTANLKKLGFQALVRVEHSNIDADSVSEPSYLCLLPGMNLQYKFSATHNLKFTYNRRITRPGIYDMNPYFKIGQNNDVSQGNPDLRPEYRDRMQLTYTWNFGNNYLSPSVYYESLTNRIGRQFSGIISPLDSTLTTFTKPFNLLSGYEYGAGINAMLWFFNINARVFKGHFDSYSSPFAFLPERDYFSYSITTYAFSPLDKEKKTNAYVFLSYNGVSQDAQTKTYNMPIFGFGAQRQFKDHSLGFFYLLPFSKEITYQRTITETPGYYVRNTTGFDVSYFIQFMYSYKFNKGKNVKKLDKKIEVESDSKSQGFGGQN